MSRRGTGAAFVVVVALALSQAPAALAENGHKGDTTTYRAMDTLTATIRHDDDSLGVLSVQAGLDATDPKMRKLVEQSLPRLRDAYVRALGIYAAGSPPAQGPTPTRSLSCCSAPPTECWAGRGRSCCWAPCW